MRRCIDYPVVAGALCLLVVLLFHSPRWWIIAKQSPGTFEWDRANSYLLQCENPFRQDIEPAMRWRFVPQVFVHAVGGNQALALIIPWLGTLALSGSVNQLLRKHGYDRATAFWLCTALLSSAPVLVSTGWLGFNDAWIGLGLVVVAFGSSRTAMALACLFCPFIDERFVFGLPGAVLLRYYPFIELKWWSLFGRVAFAMTPFLVGRAVGLAFGRSGTTGFLVSSLRSSTAYLWVAPLALWMAWRFAYFPAVRRIKHELRLHPQACAAIVAGCLAPTLFGFTMAADTMRTASILLPLCLWGVTSPAKIDLNLARWLALGNLIVPAAHVTYTKITPINSALIELWRVLR